MHTLITFLGKGRENLQSGYRNATYDFDGGEKIQTPYFGLALAEHLAVDRTVVLGTATSMWDVFVEHFAKDDESNERLRLELMDRVSSGTVDSELLGRLSPMLSRSTGKKWELRLISSARTQEEQTNILHSIRDCVDSGQVSLDLTHGFRHLGMLGFLSSFMLRRMFDAIKITGLWYGALEMTDEGITPVLRLDGLSSIQDWIEALNRFDASGDYGVFTPLLEADGMPSDKARLLREAAFHEATMNISDARDKLRTVNQSLRETLHGASGLFQKTLLDRISWANRHYLSDCQRALAEHSLRRGDYLRAAALGYEGFVTAECEDQCVDPLDHSSREKIKTYLNESSDRSQESRTLQALRNGLAHGHPKADDKVRIDNSLKKHNARQVLRNQETLQKALQWSFKKLHRE